MAVIAEYALSSHFVRSCVGAVRAVSGTCTWGLAGRPCTGYSPNGPRANPRLGQSDAALERRTADGDLINRLFARLAPML